MKKLVFHVPLFFVMVILLTGCGDNNSREYTMTDSATTAPAPVVQPTPAATEGELTFSLKGEMFKDGKMSLQPLSAYYNDADGVTVVEFKGMIDKDSAVVNITFSDTKPGKFAVGKMSGKGSGKNGFTVIGWIPGADPGSKYFFLSNTGEIDITGYSDVIEGTIKGGATDIRAETPSDLSFEGSFKIKKK
jgi:hypothetical protein